MPEDSMKKVEKQGLRKGFGLEDGEERLADVERAAEEERQALQQQLVGALSMSNRAYT